MAVVTATMTVERLGSSTGERAIASVFLIGRAWTAKAPRLARIRHVTVFDARVSRAREPEPLLHAAALGIDNSRCRNRRGSH